MTAFTDPKIYKASGLPLQINLLAVVSSVAVISIIMFIFGHHWLVKTINLILCLSALYYLRYFKQNSEIKLRITPEGLFYTGFRRSGLKITKYDDKLQWTEIKDVYIEQPEKGPVQIQTTRGSRPFWNAEKPEINTDIIRELNKYIKKEMNAAEQNAQPDSQ